jgi:antitoxin component YwqK of YwqJK toxin-antitoxin module
MRNLLIISSLLIIGLNGFGQENSLEYKRKPIKLTQKEFFDNSTPVDTIIRQKFHGNGLISQEEIIWRIYNENFGDTLLWYLERKFVRPTGQIKQHITYTLDVVTETFYDKEGTITFESFVEYEYKDPNKRIYNIGPRGSLSPICYTKEFINYYNGKIRRKGKTKPTKKDGIWEYYSKETSKLEKTITYDMGKKISMNKLK